MDISATFKPPLSEQGTRGEFVILVEGMTKTAEEANPENVDYAALVRELMEQGIARRGCPDCRQTVRRAQT